MYIQMDGNHGIHENEEFLYILRGRLVVVVAVHGWGKEKREKERMEMSVLGKEER